MRNLYNVNCSLRMPLIYHFSALSVACWCIYPIMACVKI